jgi:exopolysaccharide biosynthesis polyprenyl glycosylphosphotransferase
MPQAESAVQRRRRRAPALARVATPWRSEPAVPTEPTPPQAITETEGRRAAEHRDARYRRSLAVADALSALVALTLCVSVLGDDALHPMSLLALPLVVLVFKVQGLYDRDELLIRKTTIDEAPKLFQSATLFTLVIWIGDGLLVSGTLGDTQVVVLWASLLLFTILGRRTARTFARKITAAERCLYIGDPDGCARLRHKLDDEEINAAVVARMSLQRTVRKGCGRRTELDELRELIAWTAVDRVVIDPSSLPDEEMLELVRTAKGVGVRVSLLPRVLDVVGASIIADDLHGMTVLGVRRFSLTRSSIALKRAFDLVTTTAGLVAVAPVLLIVSIAIKLDSRGPVFFRQTRVGRDGKEFRILKFRTMVPDAEARKAELRGEHGTDGLFKIADDPRITRVGRLLRKTSLDELPQLLNVMAGDMSLVGPRPLVADEDEQISGSDRTRLTLTPGMTGHWQILGSGRVPLHEMVKIDYLYVSSWSLWNDLKILLRTVPYMLARRGM